MYWPEDIALGHLWNIGDYPKIRREYDLIRAGIISADTVAKKIFRLWNDQKYGTTFYNKFHKFEPQTYCKIGDLVVKEGQLHFSRMHVGLTSGAPDYIALGTANPTPTLADFNLATEVIRKSIITDGGYRDLVGEDEYYGMLFLPSIGTNTYGEAGLFRGSSAAVGDNMITHNKFTPTLAHTVNNNAPGVEIIVRHRSYVV
jgi:hypothetical protein